MVLSRLYEALYKHFITPFVSVKFQAPSGKVYDVGSVWTDPDHKEIVLSIYDISPDQNSLFHRGYKLIYND